MGQLVTLNESGVVLGNRTINAGLRQTVPTVSDASGLQDLPVPGFSASARALNNNGLVAGSGQASASALPMAMVWQDGVVTDLGGFFPDDMSSAATVVNDNGRVAGRVDGPFRKRSVFLWGPDGMQDLGRPPGCSHACTPNGMNNAGQVVGQARDDSEWAPHYQGWIWQEGTYTPLQDLVDLPDATIEIPVAIDDQGRIAVGGRPLDRTEGARALLLVPMTSL